MTLGMRRYSAAALVLAALLVPASFGLAKLDRDHAVEKLDTALANEASQQRTALEAYFARARAIILLTARNPSFSDFYKAPGGRPAKIAAGGPLIDRANGALLYLEKLYPESIGEACFIDRGGPENARAVRGIIASQSELSPDESAAPFFRPTFAMRPGEVFQARPYVSPDTHEWVIANATPVPTPGGVRSIVHFEVTVESFRRAAEHQTRAFELSVVDARTGAVVIDSRTPQRVGARLGVPGDRRFALLRGTQVNDGSLSVSGRRAAVQRVRRAAGNANDWLVVAVAKTPAPSLVDHFGAGPMGMIAAALLLVAYGLLSNRAGALRKQAETDELTALANRRQLLTRLDAAIRAARHADTSVALVMIDLDRFKELNDTLGHHAGDLLLRAFGPRLQEVVRGADTVARLGGDEFAILLTDVADVETPVAVAKRVRSMLNDPWDLEGLSVHIDASIGIAIFPEHGETGDDLLQRADVAMYEAKAARTGIEVYASERDMHSRERLQLVGELRGALDRQELVLHYQPKASLGTREVTGVEALLR